MKNKSTDYWDGDIFFYGQKIKQLGQKRNPKQEGRKHQATMLYCVNIKLLEI